MFNNGEKRINHYNRNYWKFQLIFTIIDRGEKLSFAALDCIDWRRILFKIAELFEIYESDVCS